MHKSEKFLRQGSATVATCFGPITFGKAGVVLLRDEGEGQGECGSIGPYALSRIKGQQRRVKGEG